jgi:plastocyanin
MHKSVTLGIAAAAGFAVMAAAGFAVMATAADDHVITQKGRQFSIDAITVKKGEAITFFNDDTVPHNIMSLTTGNEFNLGSQAPGSSTPVTFSQAGDVSVICAIHPRMKLAVTVTE